MADHPLKPEDLGRINAALDEIKAAQEAVKMAARADIDTGDAGDQLAANAVKLKKIKTVYFPNQ